MKKPSNYPGQRVCLILALVGLLSGATLVLGPAERASAQVVGPSWSITVTTRFAHTATLLPNDQVLVAGGQLYRSGPDRSGPVIHTNSAELYDLAARTWSYTGNLSRARENHTATLLANGKVLVVGGGYIDFDEHAEFFNTAELYDPATEMWSVTGNLNVARAFHTAMLLPNGEVLVAGGYTLITPVSSPSYTESAELYDPATGTWSVTGNLSTDRSSHTATLLPNGKVLVAGGCCPSLNSAELYDPATRTWSITGNLSTARLGHTATLLPNGQVLVAGGYPVSVSSPSGTNSAELYDPATGTWSVTGNLSTARFGHTATLLPNGQVLVAGGGNRTGSTENSLNSTELYDPATGIWSSTANLNTARVAHTATLLPNGKVLVAGGGGPAPNSTELFDLGLPSPVLTLNSTKYCTGDSWNLKVNNATPNASMRLIGTTNGASWEIARWATTDANGSFSTSGKMTEGTEGNYTLRVEIDGVLTNVVSFTVSNCKPS